ncbi:MFS transporter [Pseudomonas costantinii]|uniref:Predicted arabinose efflux permease, MFS family n=1 Tax=Pseudomonas costantinii TaxID=168469 RepID=A0A1H5F9H2_9PSED|nr:MFS transporter [Pseudomonas costantinii]SED99768.1 Predicted arabinose efflux permease, MFS family [Pseudomonas costantinii]
MHNSSATPLAPESLRELSARTQAKKKRLILAAALGNGLATYDFTIYSFSAVAIGRMFFPSDSALGSLLMSLLTFGAGFAMRPIGALVIGNLADRKGRKAGLMWSIALMTLGTAVMVFAPPYSVIGPAATLLIVVARLMQGFAVGGEIGVSSVVLMELATRKNRCYGVSWRSASQAAAALAGALIGTCTTMMLSPEALLEWGWRIPFVVGMLIGPVGWYIRRQMPDAPMKKSRRPAIKTVLAQHSRKLCLGILLMATPSAGIYILVYYMPIYLVGTLHMPATVSLLSACLSSTLIFIGVPLLARVTDRLRLRKPIQYLTMISSIVLVYPVFLLLTSGIGEPLSLLVIGGYSLLLLCSNAATIVMILEAFPRHHRATSISVISSLGTTIFGGFCPFIVAWMIGVTGNAMAPAWYLSAAMCISLFALILFPDSLERLRSIKRAGYSANAARQ